MGTVIYQGHGLAVAQIASASIDAVDIVAEITTFTVTISGLTISQASDTDVNTTTAALVVLLNASTDTRFSAITWTNPGAPSGDITATADVAGVQFKVTLAAVGGDGTVTDFTDDTASAGPDHWNTLANWDTGVLPVDADDVIIENSAQPIIADLDQSAIELTSLTIKPSYTGTIGLPRTHSGGAYVDGRDRYLKTSATTMTIDGSGSGRINIELDTDVASTVIVNGSGTAAESGIPPILIKGGHANGTLYLNKGNVGMAFYGGETATFTTVNLDYKTTQASDAVLTCGSGAAITTLTKNGGTVSLASNITTITQKAGTVTVNGAATVATLSLQGGTGYYNSSGTLTTVNVASGAVLDFRNDPRARIVTTCSVYAGASIYDPNASVTWTNDVDLQRCSLSDVTMDLGTNLTWTLAVI